MTQLSLFDSMNSEPTIQPITDVEEFRQHLLNNAAYMQDGKMHLSQRRAFDRHKAANRISEGMCLIEEYRVYV